MAQDYYKYQKADLEIGDHESALAAGVVLPESGNIDVVGVRFKPNGKIYQFSPNGCMCPLDIPVIVETSRGLEYGTVTTKVKSVDVSKVKAPLRKVARLASMTDIRHHEENEKKRADAFNICVKKIEEHKIDMKLVDVEYTFDNNKLLFFFTADGRVDFRDLVKDLAGVFRTRIELRQIGIRDEAKLVGGLGVCGRPLCCNTFLSDFAQVSIKMAKEQNLSLNSVKISGTCGRLMCCLRYEYDVYNEQLKKMPKMESLVSTPDGEGIVCEVTPLAELIKVRFIGEGADQPPKVYKLEDLTVLRNGKRRPEDMPKNSAPREGGKPQRDRRRNGTNRDAQSNPLRNSVPTVEAKAPEQAQTKAGTQE